MTILNVKSWVLDRLDKKSTGMYIIGFYCFCASIWGADFAKLHLPFLKIPVFIGEMVMMLCLSLCGWQIFVRKIRLTRLQYLFLGYFGCIVLWAAVECLRPGGSLLALRNAALFYYPTFAFLGYFFYDSAFFSRKNVQLSLVILLWLSNISSHFGFHNFIASVLFFIILYKAAPLSKNNISIVLALCLWSYTNIFSGERAWLLASVLTGLFLIFVFVTYFLKWQKRWKWLAGFMTGTAFLLAGFHFADKVGVKTLISTPKMIQDYQEYNSFIQQKEILFKAGKLSFDPFLKWLEEHPAGGNIYLYKTQENQLPKPQVLVQQVVVDPQPLVQQVVVDPQPLVHQVAQIVETAVQRGIEKPQQQGEQVAEGPQPLGEQVAEQPKPTSRSLEVESTNIIFRLFIWRDMLVELWKGKKIFGVGLAHPQRSHSIEILGWGFHEWSSVGWITPHNSLLHLIYRAGILGIGIIVIIVVILFVLIRDFIDNRSGIGVLLSGIIIYALITANFFMILEFPYYAIPFWGLFGLALAYRHNLLS